MKTLSITQERIISDVKEYLMDRDRATYANNSAAFNDIVQYVMDSIEYCYLDNITAILVEALERYECDLKWRAEELRKEMIEKTNALMKLYREDPAMCKEILKDALLKERSLR